jgi:hypothetical protein
MRLRLGDYMGTYEVNKLILETRLIQLKKDADWWVVSGFAIMIISGSSFGLFYFFSPYTMLIFFAGILVLLKGFFLMKNWLRINGEYKKIQKTDLNATDHWIPKY